MHVQLERVIAPAALVGLRHQNALFGGHGNDGCVWEFRHVLLT